MVGRKALDFSHSRRKSNIHSTQKLEQKYITKYQIEPSSEAEFTIPQECESVSLNTIYAYNGFYNVKERSKDLLTQNLTDVVDENLCKVASKISEKKGKEQLKHDHMYRLDSLNCSIADEEHRRMAMEDDLDVTAHRN